MTALSCVLQSMRTIQKLTGPLCFAGLILMASAGRLSPVSLDRRAPDTIEAEIKGEVQSPDVYTLKYGATIKDLIEAAGGCTPGADLSMLSLQEEVRAHEVVVIRKKAREDEAPLISLNTATKEELMELPGVGESTANKIIDYRLAHGFSKLEDLMDVPGIGEKKFEKLKPFICL